MKAAVVVIFVFLGVICSTGCEQDSSADLISSGTGGDVLGAYVPFEIHIVGLTEITPVSEGPWQGKLNVYVDLVDSFGCRVKSPGVFRFELYEFVPRSSQPKGKRIFFPPDVDLTDPTDNNKYWRDFLRAYQFGLYLDFSPRPNESFVLEVTFTTPQGNRLRDTLQLGHESG